MTLGISQPRKSGNIAIRPPVSVLLNINKSNRSVLYSVAEMLRLVTSKHLPYMSVGSNPARDFGFFHM